MSPAPKAPKPAGPASVEGLVLCGGASRRMGRDKARIHLGERTLLGHSLAALAPLCGRLRLASGSAVRYADLGIPAVLDPAGLFGPAAGIVAGLQAAAPLTRYVLVLACDLPRMRPQVLGALLARAKAEGLDACFLESERGLEPLCAALSPSVAFAIRAAQAKGRRTVTAFLEEPLAEGRAVRWGVVREVELGPQWAGLDVARNVNTPEDLDRERALLAEEAGP